jgi:hypothetical protein
LKKNFLIETNITLSIIYIKMSRHFFYCVINKVLDNIDLNIHKINNNFIYYIFSNYEFNQIDEDQIDIMLKEENNKLIFYNEYIEDNLDKKNDILYNKFMKIKNFKKYYYLLNIIKKLNDNIFSELKQINLIIK